MIVKSLCGNVAVMARAKKMAASVVYRAARKRSPYDMTSYIDDWVGEGYAGSEAREIPAWEETETAPLG